MNPSLALLFSPPVEGTHYKQVIPPTASNPTGRGYRYQDAVSANQRRLEAALAPAFLRIKSELDSGEAAVAGQAVQQALTICGGIDFGEMPAVAVTDVGTVIIQWQKDDQGAMFSFNGGAEF